MNAEVLLLVGLAAFAIIRFVFEPKLTVRARDTSKGSVPSAIAIARLAATRFLGTFFLCAALGAGTALALTVWVKSVDMAAFEAEATPQDLETVSIILGHFQGAQAILSKIGLFTAVAPIALLGVGILYWSIRSTRSVEAAIQRELDRLRRSETLENLPPDERMREVNELIRIANEKHEDTRALYDLKLELDLLRRVDPSLLRRAGLQASTEPLWLRAIRVLISGFVHAGISRVAALAAAAATVLLIPASVVFASQGLSDAVAQTTLKLQEVRRNITLLIAERDTDAELESVLVNVDADADSTATPTPPDVETTEDSAGSWCDGEEPGGLAAADCRNAARFGRAFEVEWASRIRARSAPNTQRAGLTVSTRSADDVDRARREWTRERVLTESVRARTTTSVDVVRATVGDKGRWERIVLDAEMTSRTESRPVTPIGRNAEFRLREVLRARPGSVTVSIADAPLSLRELTARATSGAISAFADLSGIEGRLPGIGGKALSGALTAGASAFFEEKIIRPSDAEYLVKASDVAAKSVVVDASRSGEIAPQSMNVLEQFVDDRTARRVGEPLRQATTLRFENLPSSRRFPIVALGTRPDPHMDRTAVEAVLRQSASAGRALETAALSSYDGIFPALWGQAAQTQQAEVLRAINPELAERRYGLPPEVSERAIPPGPPHAPPPLGPRTDPPTGDVPPKRPPGKRPPGSGPMELTLRTTPSETPAPARVARARSYSGLRGFARVGGVLIGRDPETGVAVPEIDLIDFRFSISPTPEPTLKLEVEHGDGTHVTLGPYDPAIAHFALAYAADGRPTTVTMITAEPLRDLKILLHPALVDTGLGCRAIRLDQFVDEFGYSDTPVEGPRERAFHEHHGLVALFRKAWADRFFVVTQALEPELGFDQLKRTHDRKVAEYNRIVDLLNRRRTTDFDEKLPDILGMRQLEREIEDLKRRAERSNIFSGLVSELRPLVDSIEASGLPSFSHVALRALREEPARALQPLRERPEYFDRGLLRILEKCGAAGSNGTDAADFSGCVRTSVTMPPEMQKYRHSEYFSWLAPPPQIVTWSGVRERPYELDKELDFAKVPRGMAKWSLRFIIQNAMEGPPLLAMTDRPWYSHSNDETSLLSDNEPWELSELEDALQSSIRDGLSEAPAAMSVLKDYEEFTVLQRLFRAAFDGRLGLRFPIDEFSNLAQDTAAYINREEVRTPRWLPRPSALEGDFIKQFDSVYNRGVEQWEASRADDFRRIIEPCQQVLSSLAFDATSALSSCELEKKVREDFRSSAPDSKVLEKAVELDGLIAQFVSASRLRKAIGVSEDWQRSILTLDSCPVP